LLAKKWIHQESNLEPAD